MIHGFIYHSGPIYGPQILKILDHIFCNNFSKSHFLEMFAVREIELTLNARLGTENNLLNRLILLQLEPFLLSELFVIVES